MENQFLPPDDYLQAIGAVALRWAFLEEVINRSIHHLLNLDSTRGYALTDEIISTPTRLAMLRRLTATHIKDKQKLKTLGKLCDDIRTKHANRRNELMHELMEPTGLMSTTISQRGKSIRKRGHYSVDAPTPQEIYAQADQIYIFATQFRDFLRSIGALPHPSPGIFGSLGLQPSSALPTLKGSLMSDTKPQSPPEPSEESEK